MRGLKANFAVITQRLKAGWRLLAVIALGVLVAATLMAVSPVYTRVLNDLGLRYSLEQQLSGSRQNSAILTGLPFGTPEASRKVAAMEEHFTSEIGWLAGSDVRFAALSEQTLGVVGQPLPTGPTRPFVSLRSLSGMEERLEVVSGRLPQPTNDPARLEAMMAVEQAEVLRIVAGQVRTAGYIQTDCPVLPVPQSPEEAREQARLRCVPTRFTPITAQFTIVGLVRPLDRNDSLWAAGSISFMRPEVPEDRGPTVEILLPMQSLLEALPQVLPGVNSAFQYTQVANLDKLNSANLDDTRQDLARLRQQLVDDGAVPVLSLDSALAEFNRRASFSQVSLLLLLLQVVGIALYFVLLLASLLSERRADEVAVLRSRGATVKQVVALASGEALIISLPGILAAPFLASGIVALLGKTGAFKDVTGGDFLPFRLVPEAFVFGLAGAALAMVAIVLPAAFAARRGMVLFLRGAARPGQPLFQRYYLDILIAAIAGLALWELNQRGSVYDPRNVGGWSADPLLLLSPLFLIMATGSLLFRFLPSILRLATRLLQAAAGAEVALGLWQVTRSPSRYNQLALLVVMASAVGVFASTYGLTTDRSQEDRARFAAGVDVRINSIGDYTDDLEEDLARIAAVDGVESVAVAYRTALGAGLIDRFGDSVSVLAIEPEKAAGLLWSRDDFTSGDFPTLLRGLTGSPAGGEGLLMRGEPVAVSVRIEAQPQRDSSTFWLRTLDANGAYRMHEFGALSELGEQRLVASFADRLDVIQYPIAVIGLLVTQVSGRSEAPQGFLFVDDLTALYADGSALLIDDFDGALRWGAVRTSTRFRDGVDITRQGPLASGGALRLAFRSGVTTALRGAYVSDPNIPLPALVSRSFLEARGVSVGGEVELRLGTVVMPMVIQGVVDYFPGLPESAGGFVVINQRHLRFFSGLMSQDLLTAPAEAWLELDPEKRSEAIVALSRDLRYLPAQIVDSEKVLQEIRTDPVLGAGGKGILQLALAASGLILALGFILTLYLSGQGRTIEVTIMRTLGFSRAQVVVMICLEYLLIATIGLGVGVVAGLRISQTMLSFLNVTEDGQKVVPPFILATDWANLMVAFLALSVAFAGGILALALYFLRQSAGRVLRVTQ